MSLKNSNDTIGNRSRDLPFCSAVPQPLRHRVPQCCHGNVKMVSLTLLPSYKIFHSTANTIKVLRSYSKISDIFVRWFTRVKVSQQISLKVPNTKFSENFSKWGPHCYMRTADLTKPMCFLATSLFAYKYISNLPLQLYAKG
jgi:hypothetical protein